jgi:hypothetical protein
MGKNHQAGATGSGPYSVVCPQEGLIATGFATLAQANDFATRHALQGSGTAQSEDRR